MSTRQRLCAAALFVATTSVLAGCGSSGEVTQTTVTHTSTTTETTNVTEESTPTVTSEAAAPRTADTPTSTQAAVATMPNVVCMNLQAAQNKIQEAGVFFSRSEDASGAGRRQVMDSNWIVVAQTPAPGSTVTEGQAVLSVVKIGESSQC